MNMLPRAKASHPRRRGGFTLVELALAIALLGALAAFATFNWRRVVERRQIEFSRQILSAIDAAKLNWREAQGDSVSFDVVPTFGDLAPYLAIDGRTGIASLADYSGRTGGRTFSINALGARASCTPALEASERTVRPGGSVIVGPVEADPTPRPEGSRRD